MLTNDSTFNKILYIACFLMPAIADAEDKPKNPFKIAVGIQSYLEEYTTVPEDDEGAISLFFEYEGDRFTAERDKIFYNFYQSKSLAVGVLGENNHLGFEDDSLRIFNGMEDRDADFGLGLRLAFAVGNGEIISSVSGDISGAHDSSVAKLVYKRPFILNKWNLTPSIGAIYVDDKFNNYYYGVRSQEVTATRSSYQAEGDTRYHLGLDARYQLTEKFELLGSIHQFSIPDTIKNSPLTENESEYTFALLGLSYAF